MQVTISLDYDILGVDERSARSLADELATIAPTHVRPINQERGGWETVLWIVASYFRLKLADAVVDKIAGNIVDSISAKILSFLLLETSAGRELCISLRTSFDDVDVEVIVPADGSEVFLPNSVRAISLHLQQEYLSERCVRYVLVPLAHEEFSWQALGSWRESDQIRVIWGLGSHYFPFACEAYDPMLRSIVESKDGESDDDVNS